MMRGMQHDAISLKTHGPSRRQLLVGAAGLALGPAYANNQVREAAVFAGQLRQGAHVMEGAAIVDLPELGGSEKLRASGLQLFTLLDFAGH